MIYKCFSTIVSNFGAPHVRRLAVKAIRIAALMTPAEPPSSLRREVMGLTFPSPVGLAAGFDKHGELYSSLPPLGLGFVEVGSVIPRPEPQRSQGVDEVVAILSQIPRPHPIPIGVSISMNRNTHPDQMVDDYLACLEKLWKYADYFAINLGVRTGPDLHMEEHAGTLRKVLTAAKASRTDLARITGLRRPMAVKIDCNRGDTTSLVACVQEYAFDSLILSGYVERGKERHALEGLEQVIKSLDGQMPVISVGGIRTPQDAVDRLSAGATLIQLYSGIVESGPLLPRRINSHLSSQLVGS
ncbi:MAG: hypothetical protein FJY53_00565 [Betaproteobacteria bacterium]|nr:hypothetical protein [Betaproteobacteria bacterium]